MPRSLLRGIWLDENQSDKGEFLLGISLGIPLESCYTISV